MKIGIIGLGYVGLTLAIAACDSGIDVRGTEINSKIKDSLKNNKAHFFEPGLDLLIKKYNGNKFKVLENFNSEKNYDAFIITVGTPLEKGKKVPNFKYIKSALESIKDVYTGNELIILRSTVSVGTTNNVVLPLLATLANNEKNELFVAFCPERTIEGKAIKELKSLPQIISGNNTMAKDKAHELFRKITPYIVETNKIEEAELAKLYCNTYRDMTFALGNVLSFAAQSFSIDGNDVIKYANMGYKRSQIPLPGFVAGPCLEKDAYILTNNMLDSDVKRFILNARNFNESLEDKVINWVDKYLGKEREQKVIALSGLAFKGVPETSDLRGSSAVNIARTLVKNGYKICLHDFVASKQEMKDLKLGAVYEDLNEICRVSDALLILNNNNKYKTFSFEDILKENSNYYILDAWNICYNLKSEYKCVFSLGNLLI